MRKRVWIVLIVGAMLLFISACGSSNNEGTAGENSGNEEPAVLEVEFDLPETANAGETIEPKATVTYGDELVSDADEVTFEYWKKGNEDNSTKVEADNNGDGTYTAEISFDNDGVYELYAHTTARGMHTMPKKSITVGDGGNQETENGDESQDESSHKHGSADGFSMDFAQLDNMKTGQETNLTVQLQMDEKPLESANVQYEVKSDSGNTEWVETEESEAGEYNASHTFDEAGTYTITVHVKNKDGLHEHEEHEVEVN
ncbi:FixH family protein [Lentibacillus jeotgali]|uniref:FixH family protein n=1 Tax=Lentibacillus jeotgali TaxID=558169 RepID=UPI0002626422|nr:FixH family protein [Lentibacillus jeotgali]